VNRTYIRDVGLFRFLVRTAIRQFAKRILRRGLKCRLPTGLTMDLPRDSAFGSEVFVTGARVDWGAEALFARLLDPDADVIDAGANIGYYALYASPRVRHVWAFEPDPRVLPALRANAARAPNVTVVDLALYSRRGAMRLATGGPPEVNRIVADGAAGRSIEVAVTTIDDFVERRGIARVGGIKVDVEGRDIAVLEGGCSTLLRDRPLVLAEFSSGPGSENDVGRLRRLAARTGFSLAGFVRTVRAARRYEMRWLSDADLAAGLPKMIFLVPDRLRDAFAGEIEGLSQAGSAR